MYNIHIADQNPSSVSISKELASNLSIENLKRIELQHGLKSAMVSLIREYDDNETSVAISEDIFNQLDLQPNIKYEFLLKDNKLILGPIIGMLVSRAESRLEIIMKNHELDRYVHYYEQIGGLIIAFSLEGINKDSNTIKGYLYNPSSKTWEAGFYPFPQAIFNRIIIPRNWRAYFRSVIGNNLFNSFYLNKWKMFELLSQSQEIKKHLPDTILYRSPSDAYHLLALHSKIYIKPIRGSLGDGIYMLLKTNEGYSIRYRKNMINQEENFQSWNLVKKFLLKKIPKKKYIIQQGLELNLNGDYITDFRMVVVKDQNGIWQDMGFLGRNGPKNGIVSNRSNGGSMEVGEETLKHVFNMTDEEATEFRKEIAKVAVLGAKELDSKHHYGNFGVDIGIDKDRKIWLFEYNNRDPHHYNAGYAGRLDIVYNSCLSNLLYAKYLAGYNKKVDKKVKTVGILGGMGPMATVDLFQKIIQNTPVISDENHLPIIIYNNPKIPSRTKAISGEGESPLPEMIRTAKTLEKSGVDFIVVPCNTAHYWLSKVQAEVQIPIYNMIEITASFIKENHPELKNGILLLATKETYAVGLYQNAFNKIGMTLHVPTIQEQDEIALAINEVKAGKLENNKYLHSLDNILERYQLSHISAVIGGCTEIPLLFPILKSNIMKIDPTLILANFIVKQFDSL